MTFVSRRGFLAASAAMLAASQFPVRAFLRTLLPSIFRHQLVRWTSMGALQPSLV